MVVAASAPFQDESLYARPLSLAEATQLMASGDQVIMAGGTDLYPSHVGRPFPRKIIDVSAIAELARLTVDGDRIVLGAGMSWSAIVRADLPPAFDALRQAARQVGSVQVQNRGTIGGNLCNASPAADGVPPLLILDAEVELASLRGLRRLPLSDFITGYRRTARAADEILSRIIIAPPPAGSASAFVKLGARRYLVISIVMAAALVRRAPDGTIVDARIAVGSASETAMRLTALESRLIGLAGSVTPSSILTAEDFAPLRPIDDVRASADYRRDAAFHLVAEALDRAGEA